MALSKTLILASLLVAGCSSSQKKASNEAPFNPNIAKFEGKRIAIVDIAAEPFARQIVEVALVNQLRKRGSFILVPKSDVQAVREDFQTDPSDSDSIASGAGAEASLAIRVETFSAETKDGFERETVEGDSLYEEEQGEGAKLQRTVQLRHMIGKVKIALTFTDLKSGHSETAYARGKKVVSARRKASGLKLPKRMSFLSEITESAFRRFFDRYY